MRNGSFAAANATVFLALVMGGAPKLENLKRVNALDYFASLAQMEAFTLIDYLARPLTAVRQIESDAR